MLLNAASTLNFLPFYSSVHLLCAIHTIKIHSFFLSIKNNSSFCPESLISYRTMVCAGEKRRRCLWNDEHMEKNPISSWNYLVAENSRQTKTSFGGIPERQKIAQIASFLCTYCMAFLCYRKDQQRRDQFLSSFSYSPSWMLRKL